MVIIITLYPSKKMMDSFVMKKSLNMLLHLKLKLMMKIIVTILLMINYLSIKMLVNIMYPLNKIVLFIGLVIKTFVLQTTISV